MSGPFDAAIKAGADGLATQVRGDGWIVSTGHDWDHERAVSAAVLKAALPVLVDALTVEAVRPGPDAGHDGCAPGICHAAELLCDWAGFTEEEPDADD